MKEYRDHFVAFLDILGFKAMINSNTCEEIYEIFTEIHSRSKSSMNYNGFDIDAYQHIHHKILSDSVIVYIEANIDDAFPALLDICRKLQIALADREQPILLRGGIAKGSLYYEEDIIYGQGLTQAYLLESNLARYPRIIFTGETLEAGRKTTKYMFPSLDGIVLEFEKDEDELHYLTFFTLFSKPEESKVFYDRLIDLCNNVLAKTTDASLREKYLWLKRKIEATIDRSGNLRDIYKKEREQQRATEIEEFNAKFAIYGGTI